MHKALKLGDFILQLQSTQKAGYIIPVHSFITMKTEVKEWQLLQCHVCFSRSSKPAEDQRLPRETQVNVTEVTDEARWHVPCGQWERSSCCFLPVLRSEPYRYPQLGGSTQGPYWAPPRIRHMENWLKMAGRGSSSSLAIHLIPPLAVYFSFTIKRIVTRQKRAVRPSSFIPVWFFHRLLLFGFNQKSLFEPGKDTGRGQKLSLQMLHQLKQSPFLISIMLRRCKAL